MRSPFHLGVHSSMQQAQAQALEGLLSIPGTVGGRLE